MKANSGGLSVKIAVDPDNGADHGSREQPQEWFGEIVHGARPANLLNARDGQRTRRS
jgi:hypothetical protein